MAGDHSLAEPVVEIIGNATVMPCQRYPGEPVFLGGVYAGSRPVESALLLWHGGQRELQAPAMNPERKVEGDAVYLGCLRPHFGHFLLESLSRAWYARQHRDMKVVWTYSGALTPWQQEILSLLGIEGESVFVDRPTEFERLHVPSQGFTMKCLFTDYHARELGAFRPREPVPGSRLYLSRTRLPVDRGGFENEQELETLLADNGWIIFHPQEHSVRDQLQEISRAETVLGVEGSALHSLMLLENIPCRVFSLIRSDNEVYDTIARTRRISQTRLDVPKSIVSGEGAETVYSIDMDFMKTLLERTDHLSSGVDEFRHIVVHDDSGEKHSVLMRELEAVRARAMTSTPQERRLYYRSILSENSNLDEAIRFATEAVTLGPTENHLHHHLGRLYRKSGRLKEAEAAFIRAIELAPASWDSFFHLSHIYTRQGKPDAAITACQTAANGNPNNALFLSHLGGLLLGTGDINQSRALIERAIDINPKNAHARFTRSRIHALEGEWEQAHTQILEAIALNPGNGQFRDQLTHILAQRSN